MFMKKSFCRLVASLILLMIVLLPCSVFAGVQELTAIQWYQKGYDYQVDEKDYDNAIFSYDKAIELNPQNAKTYYIKALTYQILECNSQAIQTYKLFLQYALPTDPKIETAKKRIKELGGTI